MRQITFLLSFILAAAISSNALANPAEHLIWHKKMLEKIAQQQAMNNMFKGVFSESFPNVQATATEGTFAQPLNPDDPNDQTTYQQHYWVDSSFAAGPGSPVIFFLCGEWDCAAVDFQGMVYQAQRIHANLIALEHRFYGQSKPFANDTPDTLKYLKTRYALSDAARFEVYAQKNLGMTGPWIVVGGSYSANLAAYYREKYPKLVVGALASSGPVHAVANFTQYDAHVAGQLGAACLAQVQSVVKQVEVASADPQAFAQVQSVFGASPEINDPVDFLEVVADMVAGTVQYGTKDDFCSQLLATTSPAQLLSVYAQAGLVSLGESAYEDSVQSLAASSVASDSLAWTWETCTEYGYWQTANSNPALSARSSRITEDFYNNACKTVFGLDPVDTDHINDHLFQPLQDDDTTNILFVNGTMDPWSELSIRPDNNKNANLTTYIVDNGSHCSDISPPSADDSASLQGAHNLFGQMIDKWIAGN